METILIYRGSSLLPSRRSKQSGSALLLALIFIIIVGITASGFVKLVVHEEKMARRSVQSTSLLSLAEQGVEDAIWAINNGDWSGWSSIDSGTGRYLPEKTVVLGNGASTRYHVLVQDVSAEPTIYAEALADMSTGGQLSKQIRIVYAAGSSGGGAGGGLIAEGDIDLSGQPEIDAYSSEGGKSPSETTKLDQVMVGTTEGEMKLSGQADIWGYVGINSTGIDISGPNNKILGESSNESEDLRGNIDYERVSRDFTFEFPEVEEPDWSELKNDNSVTYYSGDLPEAKNSAVALGKAGVTTVYYSKELTLSGNSDTKYRVDGPVLMYLSDGISISGQATIEIADGGSIDIYTPKDVNISGQGIVNTTSRPKNMRIYGTVDKAKDQTFSLSGQGLIEAVFYMPNAVINISGQGDVAGSIVGYEIKQSGQGNFHYDVTLGGLADDGDEVGSVNSWHELIKPSDQVDLAALAKAGGYSI